jgi:glycosyltransferase involved in cell wall biosynthesis
VVASTSSAAHLRSQDLSEISSAGANTGPLTVLIVVPTLQAGAAAAGAVELVRILSSAGHQPLVVSSGGRMAEDVAAAGGECIWLDVASSNPVIMLRNAFALVRLVRGRKCHIVHAHGRAAAWSACLAARIAGVPFLTTWYKGFREQNVFKRLYNGVMARGDRVIAVSDQIAELINDRYGTPWERIAVVPASVDFERFDPSTVSQERIDAVRRSWGAGRGDRVVLVVGRMLRRKGHHLVVQAVLRLRAMGIKDFICVFAGQDQTTRYASELWDQVQAADATDIVRLTGPVEDLPAAYAAAMVTVSAAVQPEGLQRSLIEAQAMARPVIVSDLGAGPDVVLAPPAVPEDRMTGLRFPTGDDRALAATLIRLFSLSDGERQAIGTRGRDWVLSHFNALVVAELTLKLYAEVAVARKNA